MAQAVRDTAGMNESARRVELGVLEARNQAMREFGGLSQAETEHVRAMLTGIEQARDEYEATRRTIDDLANTIDGTLNDAMHGQIKSWADLRRVAIDTLNDIIMNILRLLAVQGGGSGQSLGQAIAGGVVGLITSSGGGGGTTGVGGAGFSLPFFGGPRASGGSVMGGVAYKVGEHGEELFVPEANGTIIPAGRSGASGGRSVAVYQTITTPDANSFRSNSRQISRMANQQFQF